MANDLIDLNTPFGKRIDERLRTEKAIWLTTVNPDGTPQPNPVWFTWDGSTILVYSHNQAVRLRNLRANARVALNFDSEEGMSDVHVITGTARIAADEPPVDRCRPYMEKYAAAVKDELGSSLEDYTATYSVALRITPERFRGF